VTTTIDHVTPVNGTVLDALGCDGRPRFAETNPAVRAIFHFGASVAAGDRDGSDDRLTEGVKVRAWVPGAEAALTDAFSPLGKTPMFRAALGATRLIAKAA
jgi:hypothetical protein